MKILPTVFVATPAYGENMKAGCTSSLFMLFHRFGRERIGFDFRCLAGSLITENRNVFAATFLAGRYSHLLFVDSDIEFQPDAIMAMLEVDKDVIGLACAAKTLDWDAVKAAVEAGVPAQSLADVASSETVLLSAAEQAHPDPVPVSHVGTGVMLVKRRVFEKLAATFPELKYKPPVVAGEPTPHYNFFGPILEGGRLLGEDFSFCRRCVQCGIQPYMLRNYRTTHHGSYAYSYQPSADRRPLSENPTDKAMRYTPRSK